MTVIFDLDYTLLDTAAFKDALAASLAAFGPSRERFDETYAWTVRRDGAAYDYDPDAHIELLAEDLGGAQAMKDARTAIDRVVRKTGDFLYPGALDLLDSLRDRGVRLILLTMGNPAWQKRKIGFSGLGRMFDVVRTVASDKAAIAGEFTDGGTVVVVNDNGAEIDVMAATAPEFVYVVMRGPKPGPKTTVAAECTTITELDAAIRKALGLEK